MAALQGTGGTLRLQMGGSNCLGSKWEHPVSEGTAETHPSSQNRMPPAV